MSKEMIRKRLISIRKRITNRDEKNRRIIEELSRVKEYKDAKNILLYYPLSAEVDLLSIIGSVNSNGGKNFFFPICRKEDDYNIIPSRYINDNDLIRGDFGVIQPRIPIDQDHEIDLVIVPGIGFDGVGNRLGFGKGCYDRYLSKNRIAKKIGVSFDETIIEKVPAESHDIRMDMIVTDKKVIRCS